MRSPESCKPHVSDVFNSMSTFQNLRNPGANDDLKTDSSEYLGLVTLIRVNVCSELLLKTMGWAQFANFGSSCCLTHN